MHPKYLETMASGKPTVTKEDDIVIMEMRWLGIYDWFIKKIEPMQTGTYKYSPEEISDILEAMELMEQNREEIKDKYEKELEKEVALSQEESLHFIWCLAGERYWIGDKHKQFMDGSVDDLTT